jgi:alpha-L-fucosidase 2
MKTDCFTSIFLYSFLMFNTAAGNMLYYNQPARNWEREALPIGNGRLGAMIFGGIKQEHIQFNEDSLWVGDEQDTGAYQAFGDIYIDFESGAPTTGLSNPSMVTS